MKVHDRRNRDVTFDEITIGEEFHLSGIKLLKIGASSVERNVWRPDTKECYTYSGCATITSIKKNNKISAEDAIELDDLGFFVNNDAYSCYV